MRHGTGGRVMVALILVLGLMIGTTGGAAAAAP